MTLVIQNNSLRELWKFRALPQDCMASGMPASTSGLNALGSCSNDKTIPTSD